MKKAGFWRVGASVVACSIAAAAIAGTGHQWGNYLWDYTYNPNVQKQLKLDVYYKFSPSSGATWIAYYNQALGKWENNSRSPLDLTDRGQASGTTSLACDHTNGVVIVCADQYGTSEGWVGIAEIDAIGNDILWATAKFNDSYYSPTSPYAGTYNNDAQRQFVACHEIGHTWGLGHLDTSFYNRNKGSCMDYTADPDGGGSNPDNRNPGTVDWDVLNSSTMYGILSGGKGGGKGGGGGKPNKLDPFEFRSVGNGPPEGSPSGRFGMIVGYDDEGRPNEYVRYPGGGHERRVFVTWAKGYRPEHSRAPA